jgi:hypothetical protein
MHVTLCDMAIIFSLKLKGATPILSKMISEWRHCLEYY